MCLGKLFDSIGCMCLTLGWYINLQLPLCVLQNRSAPMTGSLRSGIVSHERVRAIPKTISQFQYVCCKFNSSDDRIIGLGRVTQCPFKLQSPICVPLIQQLRRHHRRAWESTGNFQNKQTNIQTHIISSTLWCTLL